MAAVQRVENDDAGKNYDPSSFKNSCPGTKTSDHIESDSVKAFHDALNDGLRVLGNDDIVLKEEQYEALLAVAVHRKDCLVVLPTGFGKSLIYQLLPFVLDYLISLDHVAEKENESSIVVVSPLNALMRDQVSKLQDKISVAILKNKYETSDLYAAKSYDLEELVDSMPRIIFAHPESLVNDRRALKLLKSKKWQASVSAIVVDEAHLVIDW